MKSQASQDIQASFLHKSSNLHRHDIQKMARAIAHFLDSSLTIPGTGIKIGLDPIIGLLPGIGDLLSNALGSMLLFLATKAGVPKIVIFRMALNIFLNLTVGAIPGIGDAFSVWFKSNLKNAQLLDRHCQPTSYHTTWSDWSYVGVIMGGIVLVMMAVLFGAWSLLSFIVSGIS